MLSKTLTHLLTQLVEYSGCERPVEAFHGDPLTLHLPPLHLKTYAVVSRNPNMLKEISSHMAVLGRKEVGALWEGKGTLC